MYWLFVALAGLSVLLNLWQWYAGKRFRFGTSRSHFSPALSILRPLKGCDAETERCLKSWFLVDYPGEHELIFGVAMESDPVCEVVRGLMAKYPERRAELIICQPILGANAKVSSLCYLAKRANHEHLVIADQDVCVSEQFLGQFIQPLREESVGLVNCFYVLADSHGLAMQLQSVAVNADFWTQVLQKNMLTPMDFALGAVVATTKARLAQIGGFETLLDYLADDYHLGRRIAEAGGRLEICSVPVECRSEPQGASAVWRHHLRWARTIRVCAPTPYFFSVLSNGTVWPLIAFVANRSMGLAWFGGALIVRILTAASNYRSLTGKAGWKAGILAPLKDLLHVATWAAAFLGNEITWRGQRFRVDRGGKMTRLA